MPSMSQNVRRGKEKNLHLCPDFLAHRQVILTRNNNVNISLYILITQQRNCKLLFLRTKFQLLLCHDYSSSPQDLLSLPMTLEVALVPWCSDYSPRLLFEVRFTKGKLGSDSMKAISAPFLEFFPIPSLLYHRARWKQRAFLNIIHFLCKFGCLTKYSDSGSFVGYIPVSDLSSMIGRHQQTLLVSALKLSIIWGSTFLL